MKYLLLILLLSGCSAAPELERVSINDYQRLERCWLDEAGNFSAHIVVARAENTAVPYLISKRCLVEDNYPADVSVFNSVSLMQLEITENLVNLIDLRGVKFESNINTHAILPGLDSKIYNVEGKVVENRVAGERVLQFTHIIRLYEEDWNFGYLVRSSPHIPPEG